MGIIFNTLFRDTVLALNLVTLVLSTAVYMSGILATTLPAPLAYVNYTNPLKYAAQNLAALSLGSITFTCTEAQQTDGSCPLPTGKDVLDLYGLNMTPAHSLAALAGATAAYRLLAYTVLKLRSWRK